MKVREYTLLSECVERGVQVGWTRAHKHTNTPSFDQLHSAITDAVMLSVAEYFVFEDSYDD